MTQDEAKAQILEICSKVSKNKVYNHIRCHYEELFEYIETYFDWPSETKSGIKLMWILNDIHEIPKCIECGEDIPINRLHKADKTYMFCSKYCADHSKHTREQYKKTCMEKYGAEHNMKSEKGMTEYIDGIQKKYGKDITNICQVKSVKEKIHQTNIEKYGCISPFGSSDVQEKAKQTFIDKYGVDNPFSSPSIQEKCDQTMLIKYGTTVPAKNKSIQQKIEQTTFERYGVKCALQLTSVQNDSHIALKIKSYNEFIMTDEFDSPMFSLEQYLDRKDDSELLPFKCRKCGLEFMSKHHDGIHDHCPKCYPKEHKSEEQNIFNFLNTFKYACFTNDRSVISPQELDFYIPEANLAIEYDGLFWHSCEWGKPENYHLNKTLECEKKGIHLIHIFENEWKNKNSTIKTILKNVLNDRISSEIDYTINIMPNHEAFNVQRSNSIHGNADFDIAFTLNTKNDIISLMTFKNIKHDVWRMNEYCIIKNHDIDGGQLKLIHEFEKICKPSLIFTRIDKRWKTKDHLNNIGFDLDIEEKPNWWFFKNGKITNDLNHQSQCNIEKIKELIDVYDDNISIEENMMSNKIFKIYDCGYLIGSKLCKESFKEERDKIIEDIMKVESKGQYFCLS